MEWYTKQIDGRHRNIKVPISPRLIYVFKSIPVKITKGSLQKLTFFPTNVYGNSKAWE